MEYTIQERKENIRRLPTKELKTYDKEYRLGRLYKFARDEARAELKRREKGKMEVRRKPIKPKNPFDINWDF